MGVDVERIKVRATVAACTSCGLREVANQPVPFSGPSPTAIAVVGEAPGKMEDAVGAPFVGPSGDLLRQTLIELRFNVSTIAFVNAVSCWPDRTPTTGEVASCSPNLVAQLELINPAYVLALGAVAVNGLRGGSVRLGEIRGMFWHAQIAHKPWVLATWHPSAVLRNGSLKETFEGDIAYFGLIADQEIDKDIAGIFCIKCGAPCTYRYYELPYCDKHKPKGATSEGR